MDQHPGSVRNVAYTLGYYRELSPTTIAAALEMQGLRAPNLGAPLNYCELGMGYGVPLLANAACFPHMRFFGNDFNPQHTSYVCEFARDAGLRNIEVFEDSFEQLHARDLPPMDFIVMHGVYSWVTPEQRKDIVKFIARQLKPGGVVYVSHNALPGWAPLMPLRELFNLHCRQISPPGLSPAERHRAALGFVNRLAEDGSIYLAGDAVQKQLEQLSEADEYYVAHEYFNPYWHPQYFHEVAGEMAAAGLVHAARAQLGDHADAALLHEAARSQLAEVSDASLRESLRDYWINRKFRRDLYVRAASPAAVRDEQARRLDRPWVLCNARADLVDVKLHGIDVDASAALLDAVARQPVSVRELLERPALAGHGQDKLLHALLQLSGMGHVQPALPPTQSEAAHDSVRRFNDTVLTRMGDDGMQHLASPVTGQADGWTRLSLLQVALARKGITDAQQMAQGMRSTLAAQGKPVQRAGRELGEEEAQGFLLEGSRRFLSHEAPLLRALGVL